MASYDDTLRKNLDMVFRAGGLGSKYGQVYENFLVIIIVLAVR